MPKIIPFGDRILVRRRTVGNTLGKEGIIVAPQTTAGTETDLADVVYLPERTLADKSLLENSETIITNISKKVSEGDPNAYQALEDFRKFLFNMMIKEGDAVMISKYVGVTFHDNQGSGELTLVSLSDIIGLVVDDK